MKKIIEKITIHSILIFVSLLSIFPFIWLISTSLKGNSENIFAYPPQIIPQDFTWANYSGVWDKVDFIGYFINSMIVAGGTVLLYLIFIGRVSSCKNGIQGQKNYIFRNFSNNNDPFSGNNASCIFNHFKAASCR